MNLIDVKEEPGRECKHTEVCEQGLRWPRESDMRCRLWGGNRLRDGQMDSFLRFLDGTLFQADMRAWIWMQADLQNNADDFILHKMSTKSGYRGAMFTCRVCSRVCKMQWRKDDTAEQAKCRKQLRAFLGYASEGRPHQPIQ